MQHWYISHCVSLSLNQKKLNFTTNSDNDMNYEMFV